MEITPVTPLSHEQFSYLMGLQDKLNQQMSKVNYGTDDWQSQRWNWGLAILDETMELLTTMGWKWWKGSDKYRVGITPFNIKQLQLEAIDILHFGLSHSFAFNRNPQDTFYGQLLDKGSAWSAIWKIQREAITQGCLHWGAWYNLCHYLELPAGLIIDTYVGKYALNKFRQDNGYGSDTYQKHWDVPTFENNNEDNAFLEAVIYQCHSSGIPVTDKSVYEGLQTYYDMRKNK